MELRRAILWGMGRGVECAVSGGVVSCSLEDPENGPPVGKRFERNSNYSAKRKQPVAVFGANARNVVPIAATAAAARGVSYRLVVIFSYCGNWSAIRECEK